MQTYTAEEYQNVLDEIDGGQSHRLNKRGQDICASALRIASRVDEDELARVLCDRMEVGGSGFASYSDRRREPWRQHARAIIAYLKGEE